jgi:deoxyribodipyrimidine photo-lyase
MHNRARMVAASFLVKDLLIPWQEGARWFWETLVDADLAQNSMGWQWTSGCGADAAPYFRVFNPISQGAKFDPEGSYVRQWVPELAALPDQWLHQPHLAPAEIRKRAGVILDETYPSPIISHTAARERALAAYARLKESSALALSAKPALLDAPRPPEPQGRVSAPAHSAPRPLAAAIHGTRSRNR